MYPSLSFVKISDVHCESRAHRRAQSEALDVSTDRSFWALLIEGIDSCNRILRNLIRCEGALTDDDGDIGGLVHLELDTPSFN